MIPGTVPDGTVQVGMVQVGGWIPGLTRGGVRAGTIPGTDRVGVVPGMVRAGADLGVRAGMIPGADLGDRDGADLGVLIRWFITGLSTAFPIQSELLIVMALPAEWAHILRFIQPQAAGRAIIRQIPEVTICLRVPAAQPGTVEPAVPPLTGVTVRHPAGVLLPAVRTVWGAVV